MYILRSSFCVVPCLADRLLRTSGCRVCVLECRPPALASSASESELQGMQVVKASNKRKSKQVKSSPVISPRHVADVVAAPTVDAPIAASADVALPDDDDDWVKV